MPKSNHQQSHDQPTARDELRHIIAYCPTGHGMDALRWHIAAQAPDLILKDLDDPAEQCPDLLLLAAPAEAQGLGLVLAHVRAARRRKPDIPILVQLESCTEENMNALLQTGASGIVMADAIPELLLGAIRFALAGGHFVPAELYASFSRRDFSQESVAQTWTAEPSALPDTTFTPREVEVLERLRQGLQNKIIAYELGISESTVKVHLRNVMKKLRATNRTQVAFMLRGVLSLEASSRTPHGSPALTRAEQVAHLAT